jgi:hypothetical protein
MSTVTPLTSALDQRLRHAIATALPEAGDTDPQVRPSEHADFQADGILPLAKPLRSNPRQLATTVAAALRAEAPATDDLIAECEVSGPGFLNLTLAATAIWRQVAARLATPRLGIPAADGGNVTVIDYSQPNIAKQMHVGHLRSTIIGDALVRILEFTGTKVIRQNHLGDWGTQFGMLIQYLFEHPTYAPLPPNTRPARRRSPGSPPSTSRPASGSRPIPPSWNARGVGWSTSRPATRRPWPPGRSWWTSPRSTSTTSTSVSVCYSPTTTP